MVDHDSGPTAVRLNNEATIHTAAEIHRTLCDTLRAHDVVSVDVTMIDRCDLTLVQTIECARRSAAREGKSLVLSAPASGAVLEMLERAGMVGPRPQASREFWLQTQGVHQ